MAPHTRRSGIPGGLRVQLLLGFGIFVVAALLFVLLTSMLLTRRNMQAHATEHAHNLAQVLAHHLSSTDAEHTTASLERITELTPVNFVATSQRDQWTTAGSPVLVHTWQQLAVHPDNTPNHIFTTADGEPVLFITTPLLVNEPEAHDHPVLAIAMPLSGIQLRLSESSRLLWLYLLISAVFVVLIGYAFLTLLIMRPLRAISVATRRAAQGDFASPITRIPRNEFGHVAQSFNNMLNEIEHNKKTLQKQITALQIAHQNLQSAQASLVRSEKLASVGHLSAGVAHEIGNPLAALIGYTEILEDDSLEPALREEILEQMHTQLHRIRTVIRNLLDYSRDDAAEEPGPTSLDACVHEALDLIRTQSAYRAIHFEVHPMNELPPVHGVHAHIVQVLMNILLNACHALVEKPENSKEPPRIDISGHVNDTSTHPIVLKITDNAHGIAPEALSNVFDPFFTTKPTGEGTGLGLYVSLNIMKSFDGDIHIESTPGVGTTVELLLLR